MTLEIVMPSALVYFTDTSTLVTFSYETVTAFGSRVASPLVIPLTLTSGTEPTTVTTMVSVTLDIAEATGAGIFAAILYTLVYI